MWQAMNSSSSLRICFEQYEFTCIDLNAESMNSQDLREFMMAKWDSPHG
jgi:hypothetical protein